MSSLILIINDGGARLCKDGRWRGFANFGTMSSCVKTYKRMSAAVKRAHRIGGRVVLIQSDETVKRHVEAGGTVIEHYPTPDMPGFVYANHTTLDQFEVV